jgi:hypothetical protein
MKRQRRENILSYISKAIYGIIGIISLFFFVSTTVMADPIPPGGFYAMVYVGGNSGDVATLSHEGSVSLDWQHYVELPPPLSSYYEQYVGSVTLTGGKQPMVDAVGEFFRDAEVVSAGGDIEYYFKVGDPDDPLLTGIQVPLKISTATSVSAAIYQLLESGGSPRVWSRAEFDLNGQVLLYTYTSAATPGQEGDADAMTFYRSAVPGALQKVRITASGGMNSLWGSGGFQAIIDPLIEIDPDARLDINGIPTPYTQLFSLEFSEGFFPASVPVPATMLLLGSGLLGLVGLRRRFKR